MNLLTILVCEDPNFGMRGHRKYWAAEYTSNLRGEHLGGTVATRWGRVPDGRQIDLTWLRGQQHKSVPVANDEAAQKFIDKKMREKQMKGYVIVKHEIEGINLGMLESSCADNGILNMKTRDGVA